MDRFFVPSHGESLLFKVGITSSTPVDLIIKGYDRDHSNSVYFEREVLFFKNAKEFDIPMPLSPENLVICAYNKNSSVSREVKINYVKADRKLAGGPLSQFSNSADMEFYNFMFNFSKQLGYLKSDEIYYSEKRNFEIKLSSKIKMKMDLLRLLLPGRSGLMER
jgi:hypothetical protein